MIFWNEIEIIEKDGKRRFRYTCNTCNKTATRDNLHIQDDELICDKCIIPILEYQIEYVSPCSTCRYSRVNQPRPLDHCDQCRQTIYKAPYYKAQDNPEADKVDEIASIDMHIRMKTSDKAKLKKVAEYFESDMTKELVALINIRYNEMRERIGEDHG